MGAAESNQPFAVMYAKHHDWLFGWLRSRLGSPHAAADLAHDTFLRILSSRDALLGLREERAYLTTTAKRLMIDQARRHAIEQAYLAELLHRADACAPSPEEILAVVQSLALIGRVLEAASPKARLAFVRHYLEGEPQSAIAQEMGVSVRMVQKHLAGVLIRCAGLPR